MHDAGTLPTLPFPKGGVVSGLRRQPHPTLSSTEERGWNGYDSSPFSRRGYGEVGVVFGLRRSVRPPSLEKRG